MKLNTRLVPTWNLHTHNHKGSLWHPMAKGFQKLYNVDFDEFNFPVTTLWNILLVNFGKKCNHIDSLLALTLIPFSYTTLKYWICLLILFQNLKHKKIVWII